MKIDNSICLLSSDNKEYKFGDFDSRYLLLYFYPKDGTPGCTKEAVDFTRLKKDFLDLDIKIAGVSSDSLESHEDFIKKENLEILLLADVDKKLLEAFDVWGEKKNYGKIYMGVIRSTFLINLDKMEVMSEWRNVRATGHADRILKEVKKILV